MEVQKELLPPAGYYPTFGEWADQSSLRGTPSFLEKLDLGKPVHFQIPDGLEDPPHWLFRSLASSKIRERHGTLAVIPGGKVCGIECDILTPDHKLIGDYSLEWQKPPAERSIQTLERLPPLQKTDQPVAVLALKDSNVYYHWMMDVLPAIHLLRQAGIRPYTFVMNGKTAMPFQVETLAMLGISRKRIVWSHPELHLESPLLVIPRCVGRFRSRWSIDFLRRELMTATGIKPAARNDRIYISRERASKRKLLNEDEVMRMLERRGFRKVHLEEMPLLEQVRLFASAEAVAGPHGAGLTNIVFCHPGTRVIEIFSPQLVHTCYPMISSLLGLRHSYLIGTGERPAEYDDVHDRRADIEVDTRQLATLLDRAGIR